MNAVVILTLVDVIAAMNHDIRIDKIGLPDSNWGFRPWSEVSLISDYLDMTNSKYPNILMEMGFSEVVLSRREDGGVAVAAK